MSDADKNAIDKLLIEPTSKCNLSCAFCPFGKRVIKQHDSNFDDLKTIIKKAFIFKYFPKVEITGGEPLLNNDTPKIIRFIKTKGATVNINTNLNVEHSILYDVITSEPDEISVSLDGLEQYSYQKYRIGGSLKTVLNNLKYMIEKKKELNTVTHINLSFLLHRYNLKDLLNVYPFAKKIGIDSLTIRDLSICHNIKVGKDFKILHSQHPDTNCYSPLKKIYISSSGDVYPCCGFRFVERASLGNIFNDSLDTIFDSIKYKWFRSFFPDNYNQFEFCRLCKKYGSTFEQKFFTHTNHN